MIFAGDILIDALPLLLRGALTTFIVWVSASLMSLVLGFVIGVVSSKKLRIRAVSNIVDTLAFVVRGIPFYVQLLIVYFVIPDLLNISLSAFSAGVLALGLCSSAYVAQIVCAGINAVPDGQWEAAYALGYTKPLLVRSIIIPQALRIVVPALGGELDQLLKSTSILAAIGFMELTRVGMNIIAREMVPITIYLAIALLYLVMSTILKVCMSQVQKRILV